MAGLEPARAFYGPTDFKSVASTVPPHRQIMRNPLPLLQRCDTGAIFSTAETTFDTASNAVDNIATPTQRTEPTRPKFEAVLDSRNRKVVGLWRRGSRYYAQLRVDLGNGRTAPRRFPLNAIDLNGARGELERKRTERLENRLRLPGRRPAFQAVVEEYFSSPSFTEKKLRTQESQRQALERWTKYFAVLSVEKVSLKKVDDYRRARIEEGTSARTVNLDVIALRQVLGYAKLCGYIDNVVQFFSPRHGGGLKALRQRPVPKRRLLSKEEFQKLIEAGTDKTTKNAQQLCFFLRFLALAGPREQEALHVARRDVDFARGFVTIGAAGDSKNSKSRSIDFSPELEDLLRELVASLPPDTSWLFPSPQRGPRDVHAKTLRESFKLVRAKAGLPRVGFHDLRHFFASQCVMAGIDFMTIASWLGHLDGGILVGKVYGHLADSHKQAAAQKLKFFK
jgi:integrase